MPCMNLHGSKPRRSVGVALQKGGAGKRLREHERWNLLALDSRRCTRAL